MNLLVVVPLPLPVLVLLLVLKVPPTALPADGIEEMVVFLAPAT